MSLPAGYVLDSQPQDTNLPSGYVLDQPMQSQPAQSMSLPSGPNISPIQPQGSNPATMALSAAGQTFGIQPTTASTPIGMAAQTVENQALAPARLSNTLGAASGPASQGAENLMQQAGTSPFMQKAAGLVAGAAVDPRSYVMPGEDANINITPKNLPGAKLGEMVSGTPASNLNRAYQGGFKSTYIDPQPLAQSGDEYGKALQGVLTKHLTPEEQAAMLINPKGEANQAISDAYTQWKAGQPISTPDAVKAKVAISTVFPNATAKNASKIAQLTEFENHLNGVIGADPSEEAQAFAKANSNYADSALRSNLSKPMPVNKSNPNEYSKLARYLVEALGIGGAATGHGMGAAAGGAATLLGTSPLAMGVLASGAGSLGRGVNTALNNPAVQALIAKYLENQSQGTPKGAQ